MLKKTGRGGNSGVKNQVKLDNSMFPEHTHIFNNPKQNYNLKGTIGGGSHFHYMWCGRESANFAIQGHLHDLSGGTVEIDFSKATLSNNGSKNPSAFSIEPEYYALMFIMKIRNN